MHDAYDAERENRKDADGHANMNGVRVKLIPKEIRQREVMAKRRKKMEKEGTLPERRHIPFYYFP